MHGALHQSLHRLAEAHRAVADELDTLRQLIAQPADEAMSPADPTAQPDLPVWDPSTDTPLMLPKVVGTRTEQDWCCITYLGGIYAINKREGRGATAAEVSHYAKKAGYRDGRAVTAWSKGNGATQNDPGKQRWVTQGGVEHWVKKMAPKLGIRLPDDLAEPWDAPDFRSGEGRPR